MPLFRTPMIGDAEQRADDRSLAALQRAAAEHGRRDGLEFQPLRARHRLSGPGARGEQDAGEPGRDAAHDVDADPVAIDVDARKARDDRIAAERVDVAPDDRSRQEQMERDGRQDQDPDQQGQAEDAADADEAERVAEDGDRLAVGHDEGDAAENRHRAQRRDHGVDAAIGDDEAVDEAGECRPPRARRRCPAAGEPVDWMAMAVDTVVRPTMAPTAMSSPPATMTTVWLIASTPRMVMPRPMLSRLRAGKEDVAAQRAEDQDQDRKRQPAG